MIEKLRNIQNNTDEITEAFTPIEHLNIDKCWITDADISRIVKAYYEYSTHDLIWRKDKRNFKNTPWGICWNVCPKGYDPEKSAEKAARYLILGIILQWEDLIKEAKRTVKDTYGITKEALQEMLHETVLPVLPVIKNAIESAFTKIVSTTEALQYTKCLKAHDLFEDIEKHDTLNVKLFKNNKLKKVVRYKLLNIIDTFLDDLLENDIKIQLKDAVIIGSNASYNYTEDSDIDLHLIVDTDNLQCPDDLYNKLYSAYRTIFNNKYDISFYGIPVEIFVETEDVPRISNGCYSILEDKWIQEPKKLSIPDIDMEKFEAEFKPWEDRYNKIVTPYKKILIETIDQTTPYMLRNDGTLLKCGDVHPYIKMFYNGSYEENKKELLKIHPEFLDWYECNSLNKETINLITEFRANPNEAILNELNDLTNQEFCRVRTSNFKYKYGGDNGEIYFRISSVGFNWYNLIWNTVHNQNFVKYITVVKDNQSFGTKSFVYYKLKGQDINKMPIEEFINASGNPIIENLESSTENEKNEIEAYIEDLYALRKESLAKDGEYGIGNLIFKECRNRGYLDNLKKLRDKLTSKELSLENLNPEVSKND